MKINFALCLLLFFPILVFADLGFSEGTLQFDNPVGTNICQQISISASGFSGRIVGRDLWKIGDCLGTCKQSLREHNLTAAELNITVTYPNELNVSPDAPIKATVCVSTKQEGTYHGVIVYRETSFINQSNGIGIGKEAGFWILITEPEKKIIIPQDKIPPNLDYMPSGNMDTPILYAVGLFVLVVVVLGIIAIIDLREAHKKEPDETQITENKKNERR